MTRMVIAEDDKESVSRALLEEGVVEVSLVFDRARGTCRASFFEQDGGPKWLGVLIQLPGFQWSTSVTLADGRTIATYNVARTPDEVVRALFLA